MRRFVYFISERVDSLLVFFSKKVSEEEFIKCSGSSPSTAPSTDALSPDTCVGPMHEKIKNGVHIIWPYIIVNPDTAWTLRACLLYELTSRTEELAPLGKLCDPWEKVIDPCVFGKNGLRMLWSRKATTCKVCNGVPFQKWICEKRQKTKGSRGPVTADAVVKRPDISPCKACNTFDNKVDEGRPYTLLALIDCDNVDAEEEFRRLSLDLEYALAMTSIRVVPPDAASDATSPGSDVSFFNAITQ